MWKSQTIYQAILRVCSAAGTKNDRENHEIGQCPIHLEAPVSCSTRKCTVLVMQGRIAWRPNPCVPLMEVQRAADCVGERIESTERWRGQEIVHTPGSFSSLAAELLQCHARGLNLKSINRRKYHLRGVNIKHGRGCKNGRPYAQSPQRTGLRLGTGSTYPSG